MPPPLPPSPSRAGYNSGYDPRRSDNHPQQEPQGLPALPPSMTVEQLWGLFLTTHAEPTPQRSATEGAEHGDGSQPRPTGQSRGRSRGQSTTPRRRPNKTPPPPLPEEEDPEGDDDDGEQPDGVFANSKMTRFFNAFMRQLRAAQSNKCNKKTPGGQLSKISRLVPREWGPFINGTDIMINGMLWQGGTPPRWTVPEASLSAKQLATLAHQRECLQISDWLKDKLPFFTDIVTRLIGRSVDTLLVGAFMGSEIDTHARPPEIITPVTLPCGRVIKPPMDMEQRKCKNHFGWHADWMSLPLVPTNALDEFYGDPQAFRDLVLAGDYEVDHNDNPYFLYPAGEFDPYNLEKGLCQGEEHKKALCAIFTSPSSIYQPAGKRTLGRGCIAHIYKIRSVTPRNIAYVATLWRNVLSSCPGWQEDDGEFSGPKFFKRIVGLFEGQTEADEDWANETIAWWNSVVFGTATDTSSRKKGWHPGGSRSQADILAEQRAARAAAASQAPASPPGDSEDSNLEDPAQETPTGANSAAAT